MKVKRKHNPCKLACHYTKYHHIVDETYLIRIS